MIVDLEPTGGARLAGRAVLMPLAIGVLALGFAALLLRPPDPGAASRARARVLAALPAPTAAVAPRPAFDAAMRGPSVLAQRTPRPSLPPLLTLPLDVANLVPSGTADASRQVVLTASDTSRPTVYRLGDGRMFVIQQTPSNRGRPVLATYTYEEGTVRGLPAQLLSSTVGPIRALVWWTEGPANYYLYSETVAIRELIRLAEQLR